MVFALYSIEIFLLYFFGFTYLYWSFVEGITFRLSLLGGRIYMAIITSVFLLLLFTFFGIKGNGYYFILDVIVVLGWMVFLIFIGKEKREGRKKAEIEIEGLRKALKKGRGDEYGILLKLAGIHEDLNKMEEALVYYRKAYSLVKNITGTKAEKKMLEIERHLEREKAEKPVVCSKCGKMNYKNSLFCENCKEMLHDSYFKYFRNYASFSLKIGLVFLFFSAIVFGIFLGIVANLVFYFLVIIDSIILRKLAGK